MAKKFSLYDKFKIRGYWYIPSKPDQRIAGILSYDMDGINLELFGHLTNIDHSEVKTNKYEIVLGQTEQGNITLYDGFQTVMTMGGIMSTHLTFNKMLIGKHFSSKEEIKLHSVNINYSYLEKWMRYDPFKENRVMEEGKLTQADMTYKFLPLFEIYIETINASVNASYNFNSSSEMYKKRVYQHTSLLNITPNEEQGLEWFLNITGELQNMLTLLMNRPVYPKRITARGDIIREGIRENIEIFILPMHEFEEKDIHLTDRYINYNLIKDRIADILNNWFSDKETKSSRGIFLRNVYTKDADWENQFLNYAKSIESFHRDTSEEEGKFLSDEMYEPIKQQMIEAIPNDIEQNFKNKLLSTLKYAHHFGFQRRVRETFRQLPMNIQQIMFKDKTKLKAFAEDITYTRDYYTHIGEIPEYYFKEWELFFANKRMHTVLYYHLCKRLGINDEVLCPVILQNDGLVNWLENADRELKN